MKKIILLLILSAFSCTKDEDQLEGSKQTIFGKWYYKEVIVDNTTFPYDDHEPCGKDYIEFYDQNKIRSIDVWSCEEDIEWIGTFSKSENNLTISNGAESRVVEIIELNENSLTYKYIFDFNGDGVSENYVERFTRK